MIRRHVEMTVCSQLTVGNDRIGRDHAEALIALKYGQAVAARRPKEALIIEFEAVSALNAGDLTVDVGPARPGPPGFIEIPGHPSNPIRRERRSTVRGQTDP